MFSSVKEVTDMSPFSWIEDGLRSPVGPDAAPLRYPERNPATRGGSSTA
jgi:hypothetical protein